MGVFSRFRRRKDEAPADSAAAEAVTEPAEASDEEAASEPSATEAPAAEAVEIPKQQSAEAAADSEAGEGART